MSTNANVAGARLVGAQADAMRTAAANESGAMQGFMGMGMAMNAGGMNAQQLFSMGQPMPTAAPEAAPTPAPAADGWKCACGAVSTGKFCTECGSKKPEADGWTCTCGAVNRGKFCSECGQKKPEGAVQYKCDKCGWEPEKGMTPPKFCPECGDRFDDGELV